MKKKTFYQTNIFWQLFCFMFLTLSIVSFIGVVQSIIGIINNGLGKNVTDIIVSLKPLIVYFPATLLLLFFFIRLEHNNVHLTNEKIYMNDDWEDENNKIQYYSEVYFTDIEAVDIIWTKRNSKGKLIRSGLMSSLVEKPYLSIKTNKGKTINFFVMYIPKKNVIKIINEIRCRMKNLGNSNEIIKDEEAYLKIRRKIKIDI